MASLTEKFRQSTIVRNSPLKPIYGKAKEFCRRIGLMAPVAITDAGMKTYRRRSAWALDARDCPCDLQLVEYLQRLNVSDRSIFHFGSGAHHWIGRENQKLAQPNQILAITASHPEHEAYVKLVLQEREIERNYKVLFSDIYTLDARNLPNFDIVTLFHLCEFYLPDQAAFLRHDDRSLLAMFVEKLNADGIVILYDRSNDWAQAKLLIEALIASQVVEPVDTYKNLRIYRRQGHHLTGAAIDRTLQVL
jgi:SAM-dependent methyltransferase